MTRSKPSKRGVAGLRCRRRLWPLVVLGIAIVLTLIAWEILRRQSPEAYEQRPLMGRSAANLRALYQALYYHSYTYGRRPEPATRWHKSLLQDRHIGGNWAFEHPNLQSGDAAYFYVPEPACQVLIYENSQIRSMIPDQQDKRLVLFKDGRILLMTNNELKEALGEASCWPSLAREAISR